MAKHTTTVFDLLKSELIRAGESEFYTNNRVVFFDDEHSFIKKIMKYDNDVEEIVTRMFFQGEKLLSPESDKQFKKAFVNRFLNRQISRQTVEDFSSQVVYTFLINYDYLNRVYDEMEKYVTGETVGSSKSTDNKTNDNRTLVSTLPQSDINLNVDNTELAYGDTNTISRNKDSGNNSNESKSNNFNLDNLVKIQEMLVPVFKQFDKNCFLQIF